ncbi:MAG TPA: PEGA domain-containing protein [Myxococcaceae bacterium]|jgi:serine/threonine-protein kinase
MKLVALAVVVAGVALAGEPSTTKKAKAPAKTSATRTATSKKSKPKTDGGSGSTALEFGTLELEIKGTFTVSLDGKELGQTPLKPVKVLAGKHQLRLVNAELKIDHTEEVVVQPRQHSTFQISLE